MADNVYQVGDLVPLEATFRDASGLGADTTVTLTVRAPDGTLTTPTPAHPSTGVYHYDLSASQPGLWWYTFKGTGGVAAADRNSFYVEEDWISSSGPLNPHALIALDEARLYVLGDVTDDTQDRKLIDRINAYSEAVYAYTGREWKPVTTGATRTFWYPGYGMLSLAPYDLRTLTSITAFTDYPTTYQATLTAGSATVVGDYRTPVDPLTNTIRWVDFGEHPFLYPSVPWLLDTQWWYGRPSTRYQFSVTGDWGIGTVPEDVKLAVKIAVAEGFRNPEGGATRTFGDLTITEPSDFGDTSADALWRGLPREARALLTPYRDTTGVIVA